MVVATEGISKRVGDLAWRQPQCLCNSDCPKANTTTYVCASNGKTYESECQMKLESCRRGVAMHIVYQGTCQSGTDIADHHFPIRVKCGNVRLFLDVGLKTQGEKTKTPSQKTETQAFFSKKNPQKFGKTSEAFDTNYHNL